MIRDHSFLHHAMSPKVRQRVLVAAGLLIVVLVVAAYLDRQGATVGLVSALTKFASLAVALAGILNPGFFMILLYPLGITYSSFGVPVGPVTLSVERVVVLVVLAGILMHSLRSRVYFPSLPGPLILGAICLLLAPLPSFLAHSSTNTAGATFAYLSLLQKIGFGYLTIMFITDERRLRIAVRALIASYTISSVIGVVIVIATGDLGVHRFAHVPSALEEHLRPFLGELQLPVIAAIFCFAEVNFSRTSRQRTAWGALAALMLFASTLTLRRQMLLNVPLAALSVFMITRGRPRMVSGLVLALLVMGGALFLLPSHPWQLRLSEPIDAEHDTRTILLRAGIAAWQTSPIIGTGLTSYTEASRSASDIFPHTEFFSREQISSHNSFLLFLVEGGAVALMGLLAFIASMAVVLYRGSQVIPSSYAETICRFAPLAFLQIMVFWWFGDHIILNALWFMLGLFVSAILIARKQRRWSTASSDIRSPQSEPSGARTGFRL